GMYSRRSFQSTAWDSSPVLDWPHPAGAAAAGRGHASGKRYGNRRQSLGNRHLLYSRPNGAEARKMGTHRKLCVGTADGVVLLAEQDSRWEQARSSLPGKHIEDLVTLPNGSVFCGVPGDGVYVSTDGGARWDRVLEIDVRALAAVPKEPW